MAAALRRRYPFLAPESSTVDFVIVGAGVVGLSVARQISRNIADKTTFVIERFALLPSRFAASFNDDCVA